MASARFEQGKSVAIACPTADYKVAAGHLAYEWIPRWAGDLCNLTHGRWGAAHIRKVPFQLRAAKHALLLISCKAALRSAMVHLNASLDQLRGDHVTCARREQQHKTLRSATALDSKYKRCNAASMREAENSERGISPTTSM
ncbi:unnamed protein product [Clonostachys solani]|uniref:Uncharacterized protein n=1 Tax=Clonostachys solani TaxID=160281 RepID=A0A9N9W7Z4_9HYPO|nr:unnamed protein product [Clonostachys solani]